MIGRVGTGGSGYPLPLFSVALAGALQTGLKSWLCLPVGPREGFQFSDLYGVCLTELLLLRLNGREYVLGGQSVLDKYLFPSSPPAFVDR